MQISDITTTTHETVLVLQGGGSLGAYECGVYKTLERHDIEFDIVAGTSIGAVNAAIVAGSRSESSSAKTLEEFWFTLAEHITPSFLADNVRSIFSSMLASLYGNKNVFEPVWYSTDSLLNYYSIFSNYTRIPPHLYDPKPLEETLRESEKINRQYKDSISTNSRSVPNKETKRISPRLIMTSTDIQRSESVTFDSDNMEIDAGHVIACTGFPFYGLPWTKKDGLYLWDGSLLSNTPLREVIDASPKNHKRVYIVNLFPKNQKELPTNMSDIWHRARDIIHTDKTDHNIHMSKVISKYLTVMRQMHDLLNNVHIDDSMKDIFFKIEKEYHKLATERGAIIEEITKIERAEDTHFIFEDADFSIATIKKLIKQGEDDAEKALEDKSKTTPL
jgi:NTE family protein